jgi:hypothetical protein
MANRIFPVVEVAQVPSSARARFRRWVGIYGVSRLARSLRTDRRLVHYWTRQASPLVPSMTNIRSLIALSTLEPLNDGPLTYEDIIGPVKISRQTSHSFGRIRANVPRPVMTRRVI